uniref:Uncharacterized protein n=1 Tax=Rhizophagus irregularis (strain DAOM 181602 / DAOM 197198 / MUCL 43194) TaxID=747089 RepID=U9TJB0_RHIID
MLQLQTKLYSVIWFKHTDAMKQWELVEGITTSKKKRLKEQYRQRTKNRFKILPRPRVYLRHLYLSIKLTMLIIALMTDYVSNITMSKNGSLDHPHHVKLFTRGRLE